LIILKNGSDLNVRVKFINDDTVYYSRLNEQNEELLGQIPGSQLFMIKYADGSRKLFNQLSDEPIKEEKVKTKKIIFYWTSNFFNSAIKFGVYKQPEDTLIFWAKNGTLFNFETNSQNVKFSYKYRNKDSVFDVHVADNEIVYVKCGANLSFLTDKPYLKLVDSKTGKCEVTKLERMWIFSKKNKKENTTKYQ